jgi:hypothetical protein
MLRVPWGIGYQSVSVIMVRTRTVSWLPSTNSQANKRSSLMMVKKKASYSIVCSSNCLQFRWLTEPAIEGVASLHSDRLFRLHMAENRDTIGRTLRIYLKSRDEWFDGTVVGFCEQSGKHRINVESLKRERCLSLIPGEFRWTDLVDCHSHSDTHTLSTPRYMGVQRYSTTRWLAFKSKVGVHYIGTFESEKDAALAYDVYARQKGRPVNFTSDKISEAEMKQRTQDTSTEAESVN